MARVFRIPFFSGMVPRAERRALQDTQAQVATNIRLTGGGLEALYTPALVSNPGVAGALSIYKMTHLGIDYWLAWAADVDAVKGPVAGDTTNRTYFTSSSFEPRVTNFDLATAGTPYPDSWYVLGVTPPVTQASLSHSGGSGTAVSRAFVYTFVTQWGEESAPSPATDVVVGKTDGTWTIGGTTGMDTAPPNTYSISAAAWSGGALTLTVGSTFGLRAGEYVTLSDLAPTSLNTSWEVVSVPSTTTFTITMSDPGTITDQTGTATRDASHNTSGMTKNIYWSETNSAGETVYQLVKTAVAVADTSTTVAGDTTAEEEITSTDWVMPPVDLQGLLFHPSGAAVGFSKNQLCFSEPNAPYAWPEEYRFAVDHNVVGIGIYGTTVVVATEGRPYIATGVDPAAVTLTLVDQPWPCLAKRGVVSMDYGVFYPAPQGLAFIGIQGPELVTQGLYTQKEWEELTPSSFRAASYSGRYVASHTPDDTRKLLIIDRGEFASVTTATEVVDALYGDQKTGALYVVQNGGVYEWDSPSGSLLTYDWMSKEFVAPAPFNPGAARVDADFELTPEENAALEAAVAAVVAANQAIVDADTYDAEGSLAAVGEYEVGGVSFDPAPADTSEDLQFQLWINNELKFTKQLTTSRAFALPAGYKADAIAVRITGNVKVLGVVVGESMLALRGA